MPADTKNRATILIPRALHTRLANTARLLGKSIQAGAEEAILSWLDRNARLAEKKSKELPSL